MEDLSKGSLDPLAHTAPAMQDLWDALPAMPWLHKKGSRQKASRWFNWASEMETLGLYCGCMMFIVMKVAIGNKWYADYTDTPLFGQHRQVEGNVAEDCDGEELAAPVGDEPLAMDAAGEEPDGAGLGKKKMATRSTMQLAANILCNRLQVKLMKVICVTARPASQAYAMQVTICKTQAGCVERWSSKAAGGWVGTAMQIAGALASPGALGEIGFAMEGCFKESEAMHLEEMQLAGSLLRFVCKLLAGEVCEGLMFSGCFPDKLGQTLCKDGGQRKDCIGFCKLAWEQLEKCEAGMLAETSDGKWLRSFFRDLAWLDQTWAREVLISALENGFESLPAPCLEKVTSAGRALRSSKQVEDAFNMLRGEARQHRSGKRGRCSRWHKTVESGILEEADRTRLQVTDADRYAASHSIPDAMFAASGNVSSLGEEVLE